MSRSYTYYGPRKIILQADGYETAEIIQPMKAPWWDNYITEFFSENLVPFNLRDEREYIYKLTPATTPTPEVLQGRAEQLRQNGQAPPPERRGGFFGWLGFE